jgi:hypothetical protein
MANKIGRGTRTELSALGTELGSVVRLNSHNFNAFSFGFVLHEVLQLKEGGKMVTLSSVHWSFSKNKKEQGFHDWLVRVNAKVLDLPNGQFKESGTSVASKIIIINKPEEEGDFALLQSLRQR